MSNCDSREALQGVFTFDDGDWCGQICDCFLVRFPSSYSPDMLLLCGDAPWVCPKRPLGDTHTHTGLLPLSNRGVTCDEFGPEEANVDPISWSAE